MCAAFVRALFYWIRRINYEEILAREIRELSGRPRPIASRLGSCGWIVPGHFLLYLLAEFFGAESRGAVGIKP